MGFRRGSKLGAPERKGHRWINYPDTVHRKCTRCGCIMHMTSQKRNAVITYYDSNGKQTKECPSCYG